ncbi:hypothetical protein QFC22_005766 [Naganishia vaughanmartiniae]|uniref:Uncharacterized protein n=1 Tax=Naganishia vaughanmartiniae TaxID=1424756 RepID=A0ACC2WT29_9TREE|nr:hypothetical protein QFC22_005766 [Naganishia vaughanmartiniae]
MSLCKNRADGGQGTFKGDLTTCTEDSFIVPLPAFILCIGFLLCFALRRHYPGERENQEMIGMAGMKRSLASRIGGRFGTSDKESTIVPVKGARSGLNIGLSSLLVLLMAALFALHVFEMSRLNAGQLGIGILPVVTIGLALAIISMIIPVYATNASRRRARPHFFPWALVMVIFLGGMAVVLGVKLHTLYRTETLLGAAKIDKTASKNPFSNGLRKMLNIAMCAIYSLCFFLYICITVLDRRDFGRA